MTEREKLCRGVKLIAWGCVLLYLNINLGTLNILPDWLGYVLILRALPALGETEKSALLLRPLGTMLAVWEGILWVAALLGMEFNGYALEVIAAALSLYFHFQLLTNLADTAEKHGCPQRRRILTLRTVNTLLVTVMALPFPWEQYEGAAAILVLIGAVMALWICLVLFSLVRSLSAAEENTI